MLTSSRSRFHDALGVICAVLLLMFSSGAFLAAQTPAPPAEGPAGPPEQRLSPQQLDSVVAPVALYPDRLLGQILVAATYPLEIAEADQWLQQHRDLRGTSLMDAARQQSWDPSVQALVVFPDVLDRLASDIRWTTDLGNAFLAQQSDVMNAVQRLRSQAMAAGKLRSNEYENVQTQAQGDQSAIEIQPANPEEVYVPEYNPEYVWGPPDYYDYPPLDYPAFGFGWYPGVSIGGFFGGLAWNNWGWWPNWFGCNIFVNGFFFNHWGFGHWGYGGRWGYGGGWGGGGHWGNGWSAWSHDPGHRLGVPYSTRAVASRFHGSFGAAGTSGRTSSFNGRGNAGSAQAGGWSHFGRAGGAGNSVPGSRGTAGGGQWNRFGSGYQSGHRGGQSSAGSNAYRANSGTYRGNSSYYGARNYATRPSSGGGAYRMNQSFAGSSYRGPAGGGYRSYSGAHYAPSYHSAPSGGGYRGGSAFRGGGGGGGGFHASGGGGGGGSHGGGGGGRGGRR